MRAPLSILSCILVTAACGDGITPPGNSPPPDPELQCSSVTDVLLDPGESQVLDAGASGECIRIPSGNGAREYLAVAYSAAGETDLNGISGPYLWRTRSAVPAGAAAAPLPEFGRDANGAALFHTALRVRERELSSHVRASGPRVLPSAAAAIGDARSFSVCAEPSCNSFAQVAATAVYAGQHIVMFLDDSLPAGGFTAEEYRQLGRLFDDHLYGIDTLAFGRESDIDANGVVLVLVTRQVNRLCPSLGGVVSGYFYGVDLTPSEPGSNAAEVFYAAAPDPNGENGCRITRDLVARTLPGTLAHEFQHMISYNQHVVVRGGQAEDHWMNEGLSHLAEELAGRSVPNGNCIANDCLSQFVFGNVSNAYYYLLDPERWFPVYPAASTGQGPERGAAWLFLRWAIDHYGAGSSLTRGLVGTHRIGAANVSAATGIPFAQLLGEWHLANYLDDLPGFTAKNTRLQYMSWNWRFTFPGLRAQFPAQYPRSFPLVPDNSSGAFEHTGMLRGGSGRYLQIEVARASEPIDFRLSDPTGGAVAGSLDARIAVARIR